MQQLQFSETQLKEVDKMTRLFSAQEWDDIDRAFTKLTQNNGLSIDTENVMTIVRTYNDNPAVKITVDEVVSMVNREDNRQYFKWLSAEQIEYNNLQQQLGSEQSDLLHRLLPRHGLVDNEANFNLLGQFHLSNHWPINANTFQRGIDALRFTPKGYRLVWAATPDEIKARKEAKEARERAETAPKKSQLEIYKAKADAVRGATNPTTGRKYSDEIMEEYYDKYGSEETPATTPTRTPANPDEAYFEGRVRDFIRNIRSIITRADAEAEFGKGKYSNWQLTFAELQDWYSKRGVK